MKIAFLAPMLDYSGAPKMMTWLANSFFRDGADVTVITYNAEAKNRMLDPSISRRCIEIPLSKNWLKRNTIDMLRIAHRTIHYVKKNKFDLIISFTDNASIFILLLKKFMKVRFCISERLDPYTNTGKMDQLRRKCFRFADVIVFQTEYARDYFSECIKSKSVIIPNPVVINFVPQKSSLRDNRIVSVGRLDISQKRQDLLINAFSEIAAEFPEIQLVIYGDGPDKELLSDSIRRLKMENRIILAGVTEDVYASIKSARIFVLSSDYEGIPNALIEAMSIGVPVISTDCSPGGARLLIQNNENGILVPRGNKEELKKALKYLLSHAGEAEKMADNAMNIAEQFNETKIFKCWKKILNK